jgi:hypothetical protein
VPVWIRDGWEVEEKTVVAEVRAAGDSVPRVYGFIPRKNADELKRAVASYSAALTTIHTKGHPTTPEGNEAKRAMETRLAQAEKNRCNLIEELLNSTQVYIAGDADPVGGMLLETKIHEAARACPDRLYPKFHEADNPEWHRVIDRARKGDGDALEVVGHKGAPDTHSVCAAILSFVGSGKEGTKIRNHFASPGFGWPRDAVDAALIVLHEAGMLQARLGNEPVAKRKLDQKNITTTDFRVEHVTLSKVELIQLRTLFKTIGMTVAPGQESQAAPEFLTRLKSLGEQAGGDAPRPRRPDVGHIQEVNQKIGNDQLKTIFDVKERLTREMTEWRKFADKIAQREPRWRELLHLLSHGGSLPVAATARSEIAAIEKSRGLLSDPDPVPGLIATLTQALRDALNEARAACDAIRSAGVASLESSEAWKRLKTDDRESLTKQFQLASLPAIKVGSAEEVLDTLQAMKLPEWEVLRDALPTRFSNAAAAAAQLLEPKARQISLPAATIKNENELKTWLSSVDATIREKLKDGPVIV